MTKEFKLPDVGEGVAEGEIRKWLVKEGESVKEFQPLAEIMTDKVNVEMTSPFTGKVVKLSAKEGEVVKVGQPILTYESDEEGAPEKVQEKKLPRKEDHAPKVVESRSTAQVKATPAVRKRARELGIDISTVNPHDPSGRITIEDLETVAAAPKAAASAPSAARGREERVPVSGIRRKIFERMTESKKHIPHFNYTDEVDMTNIVAARNVVQRRLGEKAKVTYLPFIVKALVAAIHDHPVLNSSYDEKSNEIVIKHFYNIGIAVATDEGLVVPVIKDADSKNIERLSEEVSSLAVKARTGKLQLADVQGSTITITNVGPIGGLFSSPIINYPDSAIIAIHKIEQRPVFRDGQIVVRQMMYFTIACDHRIIDGAEAARFGNRFIEYLEHPFLLKLD